MKKSFLALAIVFALGSTSVWAHEGCAKDKKDKKECSDKKDAKGCCSKDKAAAKDASCGTAGKETAGKSCCSKDKAAAKPAETPKN